MPCVLTSCPMMKSTVPLFDHFDVALGDVVNDDVQLFAAVYSVHGAVNALPSRRGQIDATQLAVRLNGAHSDALGKAFVEERAFPGAEPGYPENSPPFRC